MVNFLFYLTMILFVIICLFLMLLVLIQKGRGGGLASAFGGAGGNTAFGSKTGDVLTWATSIIFGVFLLLAVAVNLLSNTLDDRNRANFATSTVVTGGSPETPEAPAMPALPVTPATPPAPSTPATPAPGAAK